MTLDCAGQNLKCKTLIGHLKYRQYKREKVNVEIDENDRILDLMWHKLQKIDVNSFSNTKMPIQSQINVYTDGSKTDNHVRSGYLIT